MNNHTTARLPLRPSETREILQQQLEGKIKRTGHGQFESIPQTQDGHGIPALRGNMLHQNYAHYLGHPLAEVEQAIRDDFFGNVVIYAPGQPPDTDIRPSRLKVFIDEQNIIIKIVNG